MQHMSQVALLSYLILIRLAKSFRRVDNDQSIPLGNPQLPQGIIAAITLPSTNLLFSGLLLTRIFPRCLNPTWDTDFHSTLQLNATGRRSSEFTRVSRLTATIDVFSKQGENSPHLMTTSRSKSRFTSPSFPFQCLRLACPSETSRESTGCCKGLRQPE
jgi:hypothetical protein